MRRFLFAFPTLILTMLLASTPAFACGGLIGPNGAVLLTRTTTFAGYHNGVEHYVTAFSFAGGGGAFGSLTPLPGVPFQVSVTTTGLQLTLDGTLLPAVTVAPGAIAIE